MEGSREGAPRIAGIGVMIGPEKERHPCLQPHLPGRPHAVRRAGEAGRPQRRAGLERAARWHELVEAQKKGPESPERSGGGGEQHRWRAGRWREQEKVPQDHRKRRDDWAGRNDGISAWRCIFRGDRARLNARVDLGALSAGQAGKIVKREFSGLAELIKKM